MSNAEITVSSNGAQQQAAPMVQSGGTAISAFASISNFEAAQRMAVALSKSSLVPQAYRGTEGLPNVLIAMEMAARVNMPVLMVMQSLDIIHGRPSWSSKFLIATVNASGRFTPIRFRWEGKRGEMSWGARAVAADLATGEECEGPLVDMIMARDEGWLGKSGSKWKTMPELMLMYRSASFWTRVYCPELSLGLTTSEEASDVGPGFDGLPAQMTAPSSPKVLEQALLGAPAGAPQGGEPTPPTGQAEPAKGAPAGATAQQSTGTATSSAGAASDPQAGQGNGGAGAPTATLAEVTDPLAAEIAGELQIDPGAALAVLSPLRAGKDLSYVIRYKAKGAGLSEDSVRAIAARFHASAERERGAADPKSPEGIADALKLKIETVRAAIKAGRESAESDSLDAISARLIDHGHEITAEQLGQVFERANG